LEIFPPIIFALNLIDVSIFMNENGNTFANVAILIWIVCR